MINSEIKRYLIVGISVYLFELLFIFVSIQVGLNTVLAVGCSFWLGLLASFVLQKFVTFEDKRTDNKIMIPQIIAFCLLVAFNFTFTVVATAILQDVLPALVIRTFTLAATTIWNFYLYKTRIFKITNPIID